MIGDLEDAVRVDSAGRDNVLSLATIIGRLHRSLRRSARESLQDATLPQAQIEVMRVLHQNSGLRAHQVSALLGVAPNTASTLIQQLVRLGYIERSLDDQDRRSARLSLTDAARQRIERWRDIRGTLLARTLEKLPDEDQQAIMAALPALERLAAAQESSP